MTVFLDSLSAFAIGAIIGLAAVGLGTIFAEFAEIRRLDRQAKADRERAEVITALADDIQKRAEETAALTARILGRPVEVTGQATIPFEDESK